MGVPAVCFLGIRRACFEGTCSVSGVPTACFHGSLYLCVGKNRTPELWNRRISDNCNQRRDVYWIKTANCGFPLSKGAFSKSGADRFGGWGERACEQKGTCRRKDGWTWRALCLFVCINEKCLNMVTTCSVGKLAETQYCNRVYELLICSFVQANKFY